MYKNKNKYYTKLDAINWFYFNYEGSIVSTNKVLLPSILDKKAAVYVYQSLLDKSKIYIGSTCNISQRIVGHRHCIKNKSKNCPKFYNCVRKHGWVNFRLGIIEYVDISKLNVNNKNETRKAIFSREQYYLDKMTPTLNINKIAGYRHTKKMRKSTNLQLITKSVN